MLFLQPKLTFANAPQPRTPVRQLSCPCHFLQEWARQASNSTQPEEEWVFPPAKLTTFSPQVRALLWSVGDPGSIPLSPRGRTETSVQIPSSKQGKREIEPGSSHCTQECALILSYGICCCGAPHSSEEAVSLWTNVKESLGHRFRGQMDQTSCRAEGAWEIL